MALELLLKQELLAQVFTVLSPADEQRDLKLKAPADSGFAYRL